MAYVWAKLKCSGATGTNLPSQLVQEGASADFGGSGTAAAGAEVCCEVCFTQLAGAGGETECVDAGCSSVPPECPAAVCEDFNFNAVAPTCFAPDGAECESEEIEISRGTLSPANTFTREDLTCYYCGPLCDGGAVCADFGYQATRFDGSSEVLVPMGTAADNGKVVTVTRLSCWTEDDCLACGGYGDAPTCVAPQFPVSFSCNGITCWECSDHSCSDCGYSEDEPTCAIGYVAQQVNCNGFSGCWDCVEDDYDS